MPVYYFHIRRRNGELIEDPDGMELDDFESAREIAVEDARALIVDGIKRRGAIDDEAIEITDNDNRLLGAVNLQELFEGYLSK